MDTKQYKTITIAAVFLILILNGVLFLASKSLASPLTFDVNSSTPRFTVFPEWDWFDANDWPAGATVTITVGDDCLFERESPGDFFNGDFQGCDVVSGDTVTFFDGVTTRTHVVQNLAITEVNPLEDTVSGTAYDTAEIDLYLYGTDKQIHTVADTDGNWQGDFSGVIDLVPNNCIRAYIYDDEGNSTAVESCIPLPANRFTVFPEWDFFDANDWPPDENVTITVAGKCEFERKSEGNFFNGDFQGCDVVTGDTVTFSDGVTTRTHTVRNLAITEVNSLHNTVSGTAYDSAQVDIYLYGTDKQIHTIAATDGSWQVDFSGIADLVPNDCLRAYIYDDFGDSTAVQSCIPYPHLIAFPANDAVEGWEWPNGSTVYLTIDNAPGLEWTGTAQVTTWGDPRTYVRIEFANDYDLKVGDVVTLKDGETTIQHTVQNLAVVETNAVADTITGMADRDTQVQVWPHGEDSSLVTATADEYGFWQADFSGSIDLVVGMGGRSQIVVDEYGNATAVDWNIIVPVSLLDNFDAPTLLPGWYWPNGEAGWSLPDEPGFLRLTASNSGTPTGNLLLRSVEYSDFSIETRLRFTPDTNFQFAGLVIYQDESNFLQFGRAFCDIEGACVGSGLYFDMAANASPVDGNFGTQIGDAQVVDLRLERRGNMVRAFYSLDEQGIYWFLIGSHWVSDDFQANGVGLVASQDFYTPDGDISAYYDYFALTEGGGFYPDGFHDHDQGDVPSWACNAGGWAADPDSLETDLGIEITVDGIPLDGWSSAGNYREDLDTAGVCVDGSCAFFRPLWNAALVGDNGEVSSYEPHSVNVFAQDIPSGRLVQLSSTPKTLTCRTYDIYTYDPSTATTKQVSNLRDADEYNPSWSPNGKMIAYNAWFEDGSAGIYITDLKTGEAKPLQGAQEGGVHPVWSPNGKWIAFNRDDNLYIIPSTGGAAKLVRSDGFSPDWAPSGKRLVFRQPSDGSVRTVGVDGGSGPETVIDTSGAVPVWSPDGNWIAYTKDDDIWKVQVNAQGTVFGEPIQVTSGPFADWQPSWSADSSTISYHSGYPNSDIDIWTVPALGGTPIWLTGAPIFGDYDPSYAKNSPTVAYSSFSPEGQAARTWMSPFTADMEANTWIPGPQTYQYHWVDNQTGETVDVSPLEFNVAENTPEYPGYVLLRPGRLIANSGDNCQDVSEINPSQVTRFLIGFTFDGIYQDAVTNFDSLPTWVTWDENSSRMDLAHQGIFSSTSVDWASYICTFTR